MTEATIQINGERLSEGESMTVRVALAHFRGVLGDAEFFALLGEIGEAYRTATDAILSKIVAPSALGETQGRA